MELNFTELRELVAALNQTDIAELTLKSAEFELTLRKPSALAAAAILPEGRLPMESAIAPPPSAAPTPVTVPTPAPAPAAEPAPAAKPDPNLVEITSPMVGTFYRSPGPEEPPFVSVGERIRTGQTVCIIEAMKLMNELEAEVAGEIVEILVDNAASVEFGQPLMLVRLA
ncbi:MAG TPA: acetyl-CoA carboxylase biotin carboxyl carrier protein [Trichocoleus sp.]